MRSLVSISSQPPKWVKRLRYVAQFRCAAALAVLGAGAMLGCEDEAPKPPISSPTTNISDEPSPNASILPEPLAGSQGPKIKKEGASSAEALEPAPPAPRPVATPLPLGRELPEDALRRGALGAGYSLIARIQLNHAQAEGRVGEDTVQLWPRLRIELLRELPEQPARLRAVLSSPIFGLPEKTEIRQRADRIGAIIVWPDQRSYRQAGLGALASVFSDRRVDRVPAVEAVLREEPQDGATKLRKIVLSSVLGEARWEMTPLPDLPYAAPLLCEMLADMIRIAPSAELCKEGYLPLRLEVNWKSGGSFLFEVTNYTQKRDLAFDLFRMPPAMPIYKRGELPPFSGYFLSTGQSDKLLPIKAAGEALAPMPAPPPAVEVVLSEDGQPLTATPVQEQRRPADEIVLQNTTDRPLIVMLDRTPYMWLNPGASETIRVRNSSVRYLASDFFGQKLFDLGTVAAPATVRFGPEPLPLDVP